MTLRRQLDAESLVAAVRALEALAHERTISKLKQEMDDISSPYGPSFVNEDPYVLPYDPAAVFLLETMASIARQTSSHIEDLWCANLSCGSTVPDGGAGLSYLNIFQHCYQPLPTIASYL